MERRRIGTRAVPDRKTDYLKRWTIHKYSAPKLPDEIRKKTALVAAVMMKDQWYVNTQIGHQRHPEASKAQTCRNKENSWKKGETHEPAEKIATLANGPEMPERTRMRAPDNWKKRRVTHRARDWNWGAQRPHKRIVLRTRKLGSGPRIVARTPNCGAKKRTTRAQVRGVARKKKPATSPATNLETGPASRETKIRAKGDARNSRTREKIRPLCIEAVLSTAVHH